MNTTLFFKHYTSMLPLASRPRLNLWQQQEICLRAKLHPHLKHRPATLARWATKNLNVDFEVTKSTVEKIIDRVLEVSDTFRDRRRLPAANFMQLEVKIQTFMATLAQRNRALSGRMLRVFARLKAVELGIPTEKIPKFSNGWLSRLQSRNHWVSKRCHGEAGAVSESIVVQGRKYLKEVCRRYAPKDIYNFDESGYSYRRHYNCSIVPDYFVPSGIKQDKSRVTMAVCANSTGTDKLPLLILGTAHRPMPFRSNAKSVYYVGEEDCQPSDALFQNTNTKKGWMRHETFESWLSELNVRMRKEGRHILMLIDNVSSHNVSTSFTENLTNVRLHRLPPNTTSVLQPMDQGIIKVVKNGADNRRDLRDLSFYMRGEFDVPNVDLYTAATWLAESWRDDVTQKTIANAWKKAGIVDPDQQIRDTRLNIDFLLL